MPNGRLGGKRRGRNEEITLRWHGFVFYAPCASLHMAIEY